MAKPIRIEIVGQDRSFKGAINRVESSLGGLTKKVLGFASIAGTAFAGVEVAKFGADAIGLASDLGEAAGAAETIFGEGFDRLEDSLQNSATAMGLNRVEALDLANGYGVLFKDLTDAERATTALDATSRAADVGSMFNDDPALVAANFTSAINGSSETVRKYGIDTSDAAIKQFALENSIESVDGALSEAQKKMIRHQLIMRDSSIAAGNFEETSGGLANMQRILSARFDEVKIKLGEKLLPVAINVGNFIASTLLPTFDRLASFLTDKLRPVFDTLVRSFIVFTGSFEGSTGILAGWMGTVETAGGFVGTKLLPALRQAAAFISNQVVPAIASFAQWLGTNLLPVLTRVGEYIFAQVIPAVASFAQLVLTDVVPMVQELAAKVAEELVPRFLELVETIGGQVQPIVESLKELWVNSLYPAIQLVAEYLNDYVVPQLLFLADVFIDYVVPAILKYVIPALIKIADIFFGTVLPALIKIQRFLLDHLIPILVRIGEHFLDSWDKASDAVTGIRETFEGLVGWFAGLPGSISSATVGLWDGIRDSFKSALNWIIDKWNGLSFTLPSIDFLGQSIGGQRFSTPNIPRFAVGTSSAPGGFARVGERGPEDIYLPRGAQVVPNHNIGGAGNVFNIYVTEPRSTGYQIAQDVAWHSRLGGAA